MLGFGFVELCLQLGDLCLQVDMYVYVFRRGQISVYQYGGHVLC